MKRFTCLISLIVLMSMISQKTMAYDIAVENSDGVTIYYNYINDGKELEVTHQGNYTNAQIINGDINRSMNYYQGKVVIPDEVIYMNRTRKVTSIGDLAFFFNKSDEIDSRKLTSIVIPNSVTKIGECAFYQCTGLTSIEIPNSVKWIKKWAFVGCSSLQKVIVSDIDVWCHINFEEASNPLSYARHLYSDENTEITKIVIPNSVTKIGAAFSGCSALTSIEIPNSVTSIGNGAFAGCTGLTSIEIPNSVKYLGGFNGCTGLTSIEIPNSVTSIGMNAFRGCTGLKSIEIPNSVTSIEWYAFCNCTGLKSVTIPNSVKSIGYYTFALCTNLTSVTIGSGVTEIEGDAFYECTGLTSIYSLIEKPFKIKGLNSLYYGNVFPKDVFYNATLYIPEGTLEKYKATEGWKDFVFIENIPARIETIAADEKSAQYIQLNGMYTNDLQNGLNIIRTKDGKTMKVWVK